MKEYLARFRIALAPQHHNLLPNEILSHTFFLAVQDHGTVKFPIHFTNYSPQLAISYVCFRWRRVALCTPELWNNTLLDRWMSYHIISLHLQWLLRAGWSPVNLSMDFGIAIHIDDFVNVLQKFLSTFQIKKLCLDIRYDQFMALSTLPASSSFTELDIVLTIYSPDPINETNGGLAPHLFSRLLSVTFKRPDFAIDLFDRLFVSSLPWSQLQSLEFFVYNDNPRCFVDILRSQIPILQVLHFSLCRGLLDGLTMPAL